MYLRILEIDGFKCFNTGFTIELHDGLNVLVGENGAGKTGIISAIRQLFNDSESGKRNIHERDFYRGFEPGALATEAIRIEATFSGLDQDESTAFIDWCGQEPEAKLTFTATNRESRGRYRYSIWGGHQRIKPVEVEILDLIHCVYLPPLRDAEVKLREGRQSRLARLMKALCRKEIDECRKAGVAHPLEQRVGEFNQELAESDDYAIKQANQRIGDNLKEALGMNLSQGTLIQFSEVNFSKIVEGLRLLYYPDLNGADATQFRSLEENSLGYNNLLYIASILAELILEVDEDRGEETFLRLLLIEEPEAHLHPQLQIRLLRHLRTVAAAKGIQVIVTTHSTVISSAVSVNNIIHLSRKDQPIAVPLRKCGLSDPSRRFIDRWLDVTKSNLLFSKGVILVEGIAEAIVVPELARIVLRAYGKGRDSLDDYGVSIINLNGIYFNHFMQLFCDADEKVQASNVPVRCAGLTDNDPPKSVETIEDDEGKKTIVPYLPHQESFMAGSNHALKLIPIIAKSEYGRLYAGKYKTFEYDIALESNNLSRMFAVAANHWPTQGPVKKGLDEASELNFGDMPNAQKAEYAGQLLDRIDSDDMGKGLYAQVLADALAENLGDFVVPEYIRAAILWACEAQPEGAE
ncbi:ATP-dependent nuclease [Pseudomonas sp. GL-B-12]|uniref:ATP-dependent nuclease n=1 Tax=Pseudomonas sp. GL-B-12 TaxID=2832374 RepID=UPI001CBFCCE0|nr:AAA family ATPase [Pseudomonas sp. GL-B-12]